MNKIVLVRNLNLEREMKIESGKIALSAKNPIFKSASVT